MAGTRATKKHRRKPLRGALAKAVGSVLIVVGGMLALGLRHNARDFRDKTPFAEKLPAIIGAVVCLSAGGWLVTRGKQHLARDADDVLKRDKRPPVLYLRSFKADKSARKQVGFASLVAVLSEEEQLAAVLGRLGPFVAIGRPGEKLPQLGAARKYVTDEQWQQTISELMDRARLVVFRAGDSEGLAWELEQAGRRLAPWRIIIVVPFGKKQYERFKPTAERALGRALPDHPGAVAPVGSVQGIVRFRDDGSPKFVTMRSSGFFRTSPAQPLAASFTGALKAVFRQQGVAWSKPPVNGVRVLVVGILVLSLLTGAVILGLVLTGQIGPDSSIAAS